MYRKRSHHIHMVGIGGAGMSGIAEVLLNLGYQVSGSDLVESEVTQRLALLGGAICYGHREEHLGEANVVVISSAVKQDNPEVMAARRRQIPVIPRAEMLAELMRMKYGIAVAGTHGKTTTTSMIATVLAHAGIDPTIVIGGRLDLFGTGAKLGQGEYLVAEADESDGSFLKLSPTIAVVTNIDPEHLDHYSGGIEEIKTTFLEFINKIPFYGTAILCLDDTHIQEILPKAEKRVTTYGLRRQADIHAQNLKQDNFTTQFDLLRGDEFLTQITLAMPGQHNVLNALATVAVALELEVAPETIGEALDGFSGIQRRFELCGEVDGVLVIDDYGHHPVEIRATLEGARQGFNRRLVVVFQPHRYSRTLHLREEFATSFYEADHLVVTNIYAAGEEPIEGVSGEQIYQALLEHGHKTAIFLPKHEIVDHLCRVVQPGDLVITMGAGDIWKEGRDLLRRLKDKT